jgi:DNA polymerase III subunit alpha
VEILKNGRQKGPFTDLNDLSRRVDLRQVGKRSLECLIKVGALDAFGPRGPMLEVLDQIMQISGSHHKAAQAGQLTFFGAVAGVEEENILLPPDLGLESRTSLDWEKELIGLYVSAHPLTPYLGTLRRKITHFSGQLGEAQNKEKVIVAGLVTRIRTTLTKKGDPMGFVTLEDIQGNIELVIFPKPWGLYGKLVQMDRVLTVDGKLDSENGDPKVLVDKLMVESLDQMAPDDFSSGPPEPPTRSIPRQNQPARPAAASKKPAARPSAPQKSPTSPVVEADYIPPPPDMDDWENLTPPGEDLWLDEMPAMDIPLKAAASPAPAPVVEPEPAPRPPEPVNLASAVSEPQHRMAESPPPPSTFVPFNYILPPAGASTGEDGPRMVQVVLRSCGEKERDVRRLRRVHGVLRSSPGRDHFSLMIFENNHYYMIEFPNETTGFTPELLRKLTELVGQDNIRVEPLQIH